MPESHIPAVYLIVNGPLEMSPGKIAAQAFQACQRLISAGHIMFGPELTPARFKALEAWSEHTTTIARIAKTPRMWERVKEEVDGVVMIDEGYTEVEPGSETCFASWPLYRDNLPKILSNAKVPLP